MMRLRHSVFAAAFLAAFCCFSVSAQSKFTVGTASAAPGEKSSGTLEVPAGVDAATSIPVVVVNGAKPGKILALVSGAHGTEYVSIIAIEKLIAALDPSQITGTVILVPLINKEIVDRCDYLIDYHGGDLDESLRPYAYWGPTGHEAQDRTSKEMVLAFGLDHIIIWRERPSDPA